MALPNRALLALALAMVGVLPATAVEYLPGIQWQEPPVVTPGATTDAPPSDAVVLFDGSDASAWVNGDKWQVQDGELVVGKGKIYSKQHFRDCQLHIEWASPTPVRGKGQGRGNSGVFFMAFPDGHGYEIQVLDSYENETYFDGQAGAAYKQSPPMANVTRPPGEWNAYDIFWTAPRFDEKGELVSPAYMTAVHNGVLVQNHFELQGDTAYNRPPRYRFEGEYGPISLQDHGSPVRFRNIWVRELNPAVGERIRRPHYRSGDKEWPAGKKRSRKASTKSDAAK